MLTAEKSTPSSSFYERERLKLLEHSLREGRTHVERIMETLLESVLPVTREATVICGYCKLTKQNCPGCGREVHTNELRPDLGCCVFHPAAAAERRRKYLKEVLHETKNRSSIPSLEEKRRSAKRASQRD